MSSLRTQHDRDRWWRSLEELADTPEFRAFLEAEFPTEADPHQVNRRRWLQLMGASFGLAAAGGCRWKEQDILPFAKRPEGRTPGERELYATAKPLGDSVMGLEVTCVDGRPVKIDGNPRHPQSQGATNVFAQAALLELYDPDRSQTVLLKSGKAVTESTWDDFAKTFKIHVDKLSKDEGDGFYVLAESDSSPTVASLRSRLRKSLPKAKWFEYEPTGDDNERAGAVLAFGRPLRTHLKLNAAKIILCLDADPLGLHPAAVRYARDFAAGRRPESGTMNRLYVVESGVSLTGASADHRFPLRPSQIRDFAVKLEDALRERGRTNEDNRRRVMAAENEHIPETPTSAGGDDPVVWSVLQAIVDDLLDPKNHGKSVLCAGPSQPAEVHAAVHRMNKMLGNTSGSGTIFYTQLPNADRPSYVDSMRTLVGDMNAGRVKTLLILGGNPVYNAPADLNFTEVFKKVETSIHLSGYCDETSRCCTWHLPRAHFLEAWGDGRAYDGTYSVIQPMIEPLRNGRSSIEVISMILSSVGKSELPSPEKLVQQTFHDEIAGKFGTSWQEVVREGLVVGSSWPAVDEKKNLDLKVQSGIVNALPNGPHSKGNGAGQTLEAIFRCSRSVLDGRYSNNSWLQELPDPLTKLTWGNAALIGPTTAQQLGVENESLVDVKIGGRQIRIPVYILPGQAAGTIDLWLGYGRRAAGKVGGEMPDIEPVGVDVYPLRTTSTMDVVDGVAIVPTGEKDRLAVTQNHHAIDTVGREAIEKRVGILIRQTTLEHFQKQPDFAQHMVEHPPLKSLWPDGVYEGHRWAMSIDLSKCIGCSACVVACQAENNIPVVGRQQVMKSREMHWLRVDRYFRGDPDHPEVAYQPLPCQQCEMAPCEQVCPVAATVHSDEGLNDMVYNRCVGIRYCANNCPYKVRHFNFFNYHKEFEDPKNEIAKMKYNPQVTVRSRGVMEKCTYCVQRIQTAKIVSKNTGQPIRDGQIQTACQQACPTGAIIFGDLSDDASQVHRLQQSDRAYAILAELNTRPRTVYLASVRNPNPKLQPTDEKHDRPNA